MFNRELVFQVRSIEGGGGSNFHVTDPGNFAGSGSGFYKKTGSKSGFLSGFFPDLDPDFEKCLDPDLDLAKLTRIRNPGILFQNQTKNIWLLY